MAKTYNAEEAAEILMDSDFCESEESRDSLDDDGESDSSSSESRSEIDSDSENDFSGRRISISNKEAIKTTATRGRPATRGRGTVTRGSRGRVRTRGGRRVQSLSRGSRARGRGPRTRGGTARCNTQSLDQADNNDANTAGSPIVSDNPSTNEGENITENADLGTNGGENNTENVAPNAEETDNWSETHPTVQNFQFNEESGIKIDVPADANPAFFFELFWF